MLGFTKDLPTENQCSTLNILFDISLIMSHGRPAVTLIKCFMLVNFLSFSAACLPDGRLVTTQP